MKWGPIRQAKISARRPYFGSNTRQKWEYQCSECRAWFKNDDTHVDHIEPCGELRDWADWVAFTRTAFSETDNLRVLCKPCHKER